MNAVTVNKHRGMNFKQNKEKYMTEFRARKVKGEIFVIILQSEKNINILKSCHCEFPM